MKISIALVIVWSLPLFTLGLLLKGILDILIGRDSILLYVIPRAFWGGLAMFISLLFAWVVGMSPNNVGWVTIPLALVVSVIVSRTAKTKKFLSGYLSGLFSLTILLWTAVVLRLCVFSACVGFFGEFDTRGLPSYLGMPSAVLSAYSWSGMFYALTLFGLLISSSIGITLGQFSPRKETRLSSETVRAIEARRISRFLPLVVFPLFMVIIFTGGTALGNIQAYQRKQLMTKVVIENFTENFVYGSRGERILQIGIDIKLPDIGPWLKLHYLGGFTLSTPVLKPEGYEWEPGKPYLAITPEKMTINGVPPALRLAKGVTVPHQLNPGVNLINLEYIPDIAKVGTGPYQLNINVDSDGGRERITKPYIINLILE